MNIPKYVETVIDRLENNGYSAYLVGGCVRDFLMEKTPNDFDVTTCAKPEEILSCFSDVKCLDIGIKHGTVTLVLDGKCVEVTTYRVDGKYNDSRHPENVEFTDNIVLDLSRRDFTVNAIAYSPKRGFVDEFSGISDINNKLIKCVGNPRIRFSEDSLRIMRALRFSSVLGFSIDEQTKLAVQCQKDLLKNISAERINVEFSKLLCGLDAQLIIREFKDVVFVFAPQLECASNTHFETSLNAFSKLQNELCIRLAALLWSVGNVTKAVDFLKSLKYDNKTVRFVQSVLNGINEAVACDRIGVRKFASKYGFDNSRIIFNMKNALGIIDNSEYNNLVLFLDGIKSDGDCINISMLNICGNDIADECSLSGKKIGQALEFLLGAVITSECKNDKEALIAYLKKNFEV